MAARARRILVGYDGSAGAQRALEAAADLAGYGSTLTVAAVRDGKPLVDVVSSARDRLLARHMSAHYLEPHGEPAEALIEAAAEIGADLVVVGQSSNSDELTRRALCDVLVVR